MSKKTKAVIWGDSLARGVIYDEARGRYRISPTTAVGYVAARTGVEITNRARMGMTAEGGLAQMKADLAAGVEGEIAFLEFGGNDSDFDWRAISADPTANHLPKTPIDRYEASMREMIGMAKKRGMHVMLCTLPPILSDRYFDFFSQGGLNRDNILAWLGDKNKIYRFHERYSLALSRLARECGCRLLDLRAAFLEQWDPRPYYCRDGIHPNNDGQILLGEAALAAIS